MITTVVACHNPTNIRDIAAKLHSQKSEVVVVLDRCNADLPDYVHVVRNDDGDGFLAGKCRDIGLSEAEKYGDEYIFVDDDCMPQETIVASHYKWLSCRCPLITIGRRIEKAANWQDRRETNSLTANLGLFNNNGTMLNNAALLKSCNVLWSCNFGINRLGVTLVRRMMKMYFDTDRIFNPAFDGYWGGEDSFLAYVAWSSRVNMFFIPKGANGVVHIDHPRPSDKYNMRHVETLNKEVATLAKKLATKPLTPEFFSI